MKSIRLSLLGYFLGLLGVALLVASLLVYRIAERTVAEKQRTTEQLIRTQYDRGCDAEKKRFDDTLREQAQSLARIVQVQFDMDRVEARSKLLSLHVLGLIPTSSIPNGHLLAPTWIAQGVPGEKPTKPPAKPPHRFLGWKSPVFRSFHWPRNFHDLTLRGDRLVLPGEEQVGEYFQIDSPSGNSYHSPTMAGRSFPLNPQIFAPGRLVDWHFDDTTLPPHTRVRRVVFKSSGVYRLFHESNPRRPPQPWESGPTIYVHCAAETSKRDTAIATLEQRRDEELAKISSETHESLCSLRLWLLGISLSVFAAVGVGSLWLVRRGLTPLRRLSEAVSRVSAKDFRLPLDDRPLPVELQPISDRLTNTLELLKRAFAREKQAAADISHELRTPLAALLTTTELALRKSRSSEEYRELLHDCHTSAQQMNQIVERLLTLARLDAGVDRLRLQTIDASALARQCAEVVRPLAEARELKLTIDEPAGSPSTASNGSCLVKIDPDKLREVVTNLLHNAIQYNRPGGTVGLRVGRENGSLEVEVRDTGIGMTPEVREQIFERFYRADPSRGCDDLHAGLGLAIVKEYIDLMGGSIGVDSVPEKGSTFRIVLPVRSD